MAAARFFADGIEAGLIELDAREARHAGGSRRLSVGDDVELFDGAGHEGAGRIDAVGKSNVRVAVADVVQRPRTRPELTLAVAMPKGPRQDVLIEKCTELGVAAVQPLICERSLAAASAHKRNKWRRTAIEAAKQSGQCWLPDFREQTSLDTALQHIADFDAAFVAEIGESVTLLEQCATLQCAKRVLAFVGPEGGWTDTETEELVEAGACPVSLGPNVLRIETAAIAIASILHALRKGTADKR